MEATCQDLWIYNIGKYWGNDFFSFKKEVLHSISTLKNTQDKQQKKVAKFFSPASVK